MKRAKTARKVIRRGSDEEIDPEFWARITPDERFAETWRACVPHAAHVHR
jgi:hypothetical protein